MTLRYSPNKLTHELREVPSLDEDEVEDCETAVTCWVEEEAQVVPLCWMVKDTPGVTSSNLNTEISMTDDGLIKTTEAHLPTIPTNMPSGQNGRPRLVQLVRPVTLTVIGGVTREKTRAGKRLCC